MKTVLYALSFVFTASALSLSATAQAQEVGIVHSATPIFSQIHVPRQVCSTDYSNGTAQQRCITQSYVEDRITGYTVFYEYQGRIYSMVTAQQPGQYVQIPLQNIASAQPYIVPPAVVTAPPVYYQATPAYVSPGYATPYYYPQPVRPVVVVRGGSYYGNGYGNAYGNGYGHGYGQNIHRQQGGHGGYGGSNSGFSGGYNNGFGNGYAGGIGVNRVR